MRGHAGVWVGTARDDIWAQDTLLLCPEVHRDTKQGGEGAGHSLLVPHPPCSVPRRLPSEDWTTQDPGLPGAFGQQGPLGGGERAGGERGWSIHPSSRFDTMLWAVAGAHCACSLLRAGPRPPSPRSHHRPPQPGSRSLPSPLVPSPCPHLCTSSPHQSHFIRTIWGALLPRQVPN